MDDPGDLVWIVDDVDVESELLELLDASALEGSGVLAGCFDFGEGDTAAGEEDDAVGHTCASWAGEFEGESSCVFNGVDEPFFDHLFECHLGPFRSVSGTGTWKLLYRWL